MSIADLRTSTIDLATADEAWLDVYTSVLGLVGNIVGTVYLEGLDVGPATRFEADLDLESMEIVQLAEELLVLYGERVDFVGWFGEMELDEIIELSIAQVVTFIVDCLERPAA